MKQRVVHDWKEIVLYCFNDCLNEAFSGSWMKIAVR